MKAIVIIIVLIGGVLAGVYFAGGYGTLDASKQGKAAQASITPGMTWKQVVDSVGEPQELRIMHETEKQAFGRTVKSIEPGARTNFNLQGFKSSMNEGQIQLGFIFRYDFSNSVAFVVHFDEAGTVSLVEDAMTMADLLGRD